MSTLQTANITDGTNSVETVYVARGSAKAWVNLSGTGTVLIRLSLNVSSAVDIGVGTYDYNYTAAMLNDSYAVQSTCAASGAPLYGSHGVGTPPATTSVRQNAYNNTGTLTDANYVHVAIHGDLA